MRAEPKAPPPPHTAVLLLAAGQGQRLGGVVPKALRAVQGRSLYEWSLRGLLQLPEPRQIIVVIPEDAEHRAAFAAATTAAAGAAESYITLVSGGSSRQQSVCRGLAVLAPEVEYVLVHDVARAFAPPEVFDRVLAALRSGAEAALPVVEPVDTLKEIVDSTGNAENFTVKRHIRREQLRAAQTPQGFRRKILVAAHRQAEKKSDFSDDTGLVAETLGIPVEIVAGSEMSFKITVPWDIRRAELLLQDRGRPAFTSHSRPEPTMGAVGLGVDVHSFAAPAPPGASLRLAGLEWPEQPPLNGHSDGDVIAHAAVDALLSAAGLGDIGSVFGVDRPDMRDASGKFFLTETTKLLGENGYRISSLTVQLIGNRPRFSERRQEAEAALSQALQGARVRLSATTTDGLGFLGRGEGLAALAVALIYPLRRNPHR